jgi:hypothetical protein
MLGFLDRAPLNLDAPPPPAPEAARAAAEQAAIDFWAKKPPMGTRCAACGSFIWEPGHERDGARVWLCAGCHRGQMTDEEWRAELARKPTTAPTTAPTPLPDARAALKHAIDALAAARATAEKLRAATGPALAAIERHQAARTAAHDDLEQARAAAAASAASALMGGKETRAASLKTARAALEDAEDALATARAAREQIKAQQTATTADVARLEHRARAAAIGVLRAEAAPALVERADVLRREFFDAAAAILWMSAQGALNPRDDRVQALLGFCDRAPSPSTAGARWAATLAALEADAAAPV